MKNFAIWVAVIVTFSAGKTISQTYCKDQKHFHLVPNLRFAEYTTNGQAIKIHR